MLKDNSMDKTKSLSKSRIKLGLQCHKCLYLKAYHPELENPETADGRKRINDGNMVGIEARKRFPGGVLIEEMGREVSVPKTLELLKKGEKTLFEASFVYEEVNVRVDILDWNEKLGGWDLIEVKSGNKVKTKDHVPDVAVQAYVLVGSGMKLAVCYLMHLNQKCRYPNLENLFVREDVGEDIKTWVDKMPEIVREMKEVVRGSEPALGEGTHCSSIKKCKFLKRCFKDIPEESVFRLYNARKTAWKLYGEGIVKLSDKRIVGLKDIQQRMVEAARSGKRWVNKKIISDALGKWEYPLYFLDFENLSPAIPQFDGTGPYHEIPFQFSLQKLDKPGAEIKSIEYIHLDSSDPRPGLLKELLSNIGSKGSVVAYSKVHEEKILKKLADAFPQNEKVLLSIVGRLVDPLTIIQKAVYDNEFLGSFSLKDVAPVLLEQHRDENNPIDDGVKAQIAYEEMVNPKTQEKRKKEIEQNLRDYCAQDTLDLVGLFEWLKKESSG